MHCHKMHLLEENDKLFLNIEATHRKLRSYGFTRRVIRNGNDTVSSDVSLISYIIIFSRFFLGIRKDTYIPNQFLFFFAFREKNE